MLISTWLESILGVISRIPWLQHDRKFRYAYAEWKTGSTLQLQRLAHEGMGMGSWSKTGTSVPVTEPGDALAVLDVVDLNHVRLVRPQTELRNYARDDSTITPMKHGQYVEISTLDSHV